MKKCTRCKESRALTDFWIDRRRNAPKSICKKCAPEQAREWRARNPGFEKERYQREKAQSRERHLVRKYGVTATRYAEMLSAQGGTCAICHRVSKRALHVDHDHKTGVVRGLLCRGCNHMLGVASDDPKILLRAVRYIVPQVGAEVIRAFFRNDPTGAPAMTPLETIKALPSVAFDGRCIVFADGEVLSFANTHGIENSVSAKDLIQRLATVHSALPDLLAAVEAAQARQDLADTFTCVADPVGVGRPRHELWDRLEQLDGNLRAALSRLTTTTPQKDA